MDGDIPSAEQVDAMSATEYAAYESHVRRLARRQGLELRTSRRRNPKALRHGKYTLVRVEETDDGGWRSRTLPSYQRGLVLREIHRLLAEQNQQ